MDPARIKAAKHMLLKTGETLGDLLETIDAINAKITALEDLGVEEAKEHWRDGKYLVLLGPMRAGKRRRHYIGSKPAKIQEGLDRIDRWHKRRVLIQDRDTIESKFARIVQRIEGLVATHYL